MLPTFSQQPQQQEAANADGTYTGQHQRPRCEAAKRELTPQPCDDGHDDQQDADQTGQLSASEKQKWVHLLSPLVVEMTA